MKIFVIAAAMVLYGELASAEEKEPPREVGAIRASFLSGVPDIAGVSFSLTAFRYAEIEGGYTAITPNLGIFIPGDTSMYFRAGPRWPFLERRDEDGFGATASVAILGGVRTWRHYRWTGHGSYASETLAAVNIVAALEATWWLWRIGLTAQLALGGNAWVTSSPDAPCGDGPEARLSLGLAF